MSTLIRTTNEDFPFDWFDLHVYHNSRAYRHEIYHENDKEIVDRLIEMFYMLFNQYKDNIVVYNQSWWDFCVDTWDIIQDAKDYSLKDKSIESRNYLQMLLDNKIPPGYGACCECDEWIEFLRVVLKCLVNHQAPYSPLFCDKVNHYCFYFHHTGSIGIYYPKENDAVKLILSNSKSEYRVE